MAPILTGCSGFLLAVLWMDLIFDVQVLGNRDAQGQLPESVLASIAGYYHRATTTSRPMSRLIALVMLILLGALGLHSIHGHDRGWPLLISGVLAAVPMVLALVRTVPSAVRLGKRIDSPVGQTRLARAICRDHFVCFGCMAAFMALWLVYGR